MKKDCVGEFQLFEYDNKRGDTMRDEFVEFNMDGQVCQGIDDSLYPRTTGVFKMKKPQRKGSTCVIVSLFIVTAILVAMIVGFDRIKNRTNDWAEKISPTTDEDVINSVEDDFEEIPRAIKAGFTKQTKAERDLERNEKKLANAIRNRDSAKVDLEAVTTKLENNTQQVFRVGFRTFTRENLVGELDKITERYESYKKVVEKMEPKIKKMQSLVERIKKANQDRINAFYVAQGRLSAVKARQVVQDMEESNFEISENDPLEEALSKLDEVESRQDAHDKMNQVFDDYQGFGSPEKPTEESVLQKARKALSGESKESVPFNEADAMAHAS